MLRPLSHYGRFVRPHVVRMNRPPGWILMRASLKEYCMPNDGSDKYGNIPSVNTVVDSGAETREKH